MAVENDRVFASAGGLDLKLDITHPSTPSNRAAIIFLHGGGWRQGSRAMMAPIAAEMAERGFTGLAAQYRVTGQSPWPAQIHDVKAAIRWTRAHAEGLDIDPDRIVLWGSSAGAHLALLAAGTPENPALDDAAGAPAGSARVAAVIAVHPPTAFHTGEPDGRATTAATSLMGEVASEDAARLASPLHHVGPDFPLTLLLHGTQDRVVHHSQSQRMFDALRAVRAPADLHLFHGHDHGFAALPSVRRQVAAEAAYFLDRVLISPETYRAEIEEFSVFAGRRAAPAPAT